MSKASELLKKLGEASSLTDRLTQEIIAWISDGSSEGQFNGYTDKQMVADLKTFYKLNPTDAKIVIRKYKEQNDCDNFDEDDD